MKYSAALSSDVHQQAVRHLVRQDGQEDLCFGIWYPSCGETRQTALIHHLLLPQRGERSVHGNVSFQPEYLQRALGEATAAGGGLAFLHSHPAPGWQAMSNDDVSAELKQAPAVRASTGLPLVGLTIGNDGALSGRFWDKIGPRKYERQCCETVRVCGDHLIVTYHPRLRPPLALQADLARTVSAWGEATQADLARLRIGIVGAGSVGFLVAEALARMGFSSLVLIDFDAVEVVNLDRLLFASRRDIGWAKVRVLADWLRTSATASNFTVATCEFGVTEPEGYQ